MLPIMMLMSGCIVRCIILIVGNVDTIYNNVWSRDRAINLRGAYIKRTQR
ncbi:hypothetical protein GCWU000325_00672 [Alloprevotella tannerae ATCC 51259]|uniref:Uncharacterized protein n=1 Tax=Alloprevotella tannerae ATCC 51259 TaxID=626522 RepID=C9LEP3_9BACT|nr:hypothetical protein GCWU000325_00672 [Alloprevotella tannerae ATCC 51259]